MNHNSRSERNEYAVLLGAAALSLLLDVESTKYCQLDIEATEVNRWIYGERPSRARMYAVNLPRTIALAALAAYLKRKYPAEEKNHWAWRVPLWGLVVGHGIAAIANYASFSPREPADNRAEG